MLYGETFSETHEVLAELAPTTANGAVGDHATGYVDLGDFHRGFVWMHVGTPAGASTIDIALTQATDADGTGAKPLTTPAGGTKSPTQIVAGGAGEYGGIEIRAPELDASGGFHFIQATVTVAVAAFTYSLVILGTVPRYPPVDVTGYAEVVA